MKSHLLVLSLPLVLAIPTPDAKDTASTIQVIWKHDKASSTKSLYALTEDGTGVLAQSCSDSLYTGIFHETPLKFNTDDNGSGSFAIGDKTYKVAESAEYSGGAECSRIYHGGAAHIDCLVPFSGSIAGALPIDAAIDCLPGDKSKRATSGKEIIYAGVPTVHRNPRRAASPSPPAPPAAFRNESLLQARQDPGCPGRQTYSLVGDGDPHQNYYDNQLSQKISCGSALQCEVGQEQSMSYTLEWSIASGDAISEWLSGGFAVSVSWETGNTYSCTGSTGDVVCLWYQTAHTAYTVQQYTVPQSAPGSGGCGGGSVTATGVERSPNENNNGGMQYYCVIGSCRNQGDGYWEDNAPAGGPP